MSIQNSAFSRRSLLKSAGGIAITTPLLSAESGSQAGKPTTSSIEDRDRRMQWWHEARFGMFIHFGLYSQLGHHEWAMEEEGIPVAEYQLLAQRFNPKPNAARAWAKLAREAGMKYMVMTTKHHEGYCLFDTKLTNYCAPRQAAGRDLVAEYVEAAKAERLRFGFYYSLMDWHHPDGALCLTNEAARRRFVDYIHGQVSELCTNYGKVDILWYDVDWPLTPEGWESEKMNRMVRKLQPDILLNDRAGIPEDFTTPEQRVQAYDYPWESCMTMNDSWGFNIGDDNWKTPKTVVRNLLTCARDHGNYLLNIGPKADGSIPDPSVYVLSTVGRWMDTHGELIHKADRCAVKSSETCVFTRQGNTLYVHAYFWPGETLSVGGIKPKILSAKLYLNGEPVKFEQSEWRVKLTGLPAHAPDAIATTFALECDSEPAQDMHAIRTNRKRESV